MIVYCLSVAMQLTGALLLLIYGLSSKRESILRRALGNSVFLVINEKTKVIQGATELIREKYRETYINKVAFTLLSSGYLIAVFGEMDSDKRIIGFIVIVIIAVALLLLSKLIVNKLVFLKETQILLNDELKKYNIHPGMLVVSDKE